jgi:hypothetical protein
VAGARELHALARRRQPRVDLLVAALRLQRHDVHGSGRDRLRGECHRPRGQRQLPGHPGAQPERAAFIRRDEPRKALRGVHDAVSRGEPHGGAVVHVQLGSARTRRSRSSTSTATRTSTTTRARGPRDSRTGTRSTSRCRRTSRSSDQCSSA